MSGTVLVPVHVAARVVTAPSVQPPAFRGQTPPPLEKGVHVHWALPDALTRAEVEERGGGRRLLYPAVPDVWLVVRFEPEARRIVRPGRPVIGRQLLADRPWRGWVIESRTRRRVDLAAWAPPADYATTHVLTAAGVLPVADGRPGWGVHPEGDAASHPAAHAYYPAARNLFGFHDPLDDLAGRDGVVTYVAIGWYRHAAHDPVHRTYASEALLDRWKLDWRPRSSPMHHDFSPSLHGGAAGASGIGELAGVRAVTAVRQHAPALRRVAEAARARTDIGDLVRAINGADTAGRVVDVPIGRAVKKGPDALVCHGAVLEVDLTPVARASTKGAWKVNVVSSLQRALAEVAAGGGDDAWKATIQAMILDADQKSSTMAGLIGMPNEVHALTFQGRSGTSAHYAQLDIHAPARRPVIGHAAPAAGHWPKKMIAAHISEVSAIEVRPWLPPANAPKTPPPEPTAAELAAFTQKVAQAMAALAADGKPAVHARYLRVVDHRAAPPAFTRRTGPASPAGRTFWVDREDPAAMRELLISTTGARVALPARATVWQQPGPRWYRPWSPHVVMMNTGRSYRYGFDGRFDTHGLVRCRVDGYTLSSINSSFGGKTPDPVTGSELLGQTAALGKPGVPAVARAVLEEALLLDPSNAKEIARAWLRNFKRDFAGAAAPDAAAAEKQIRQQLTSNLLLRDPTLSDDEVIAFSDAQQFTGEDPSEIAFMPWQQPWEPLFANIKYTFQPAAAGALGAVDAAIGAPAGAPIQHTEQQLLGAAVSKVLDSAIVGKVVVGPTGHLIPANAPAGLDSDDFLRLDVLSTALTGFDDHVFAAGVRLRAGTLRVDQIEVVGELGVAETIAAPGPNAWQTPLAPRLPTWSRVQLRLMSAQEPDAEADFARSPVCGFLVPDLLEHTLEVYDPDGRALGQLVSDAPVLHTADTLVGSGPNATPKTPPPPVRYEPHPWRPSAPLDAASPYLKQFVDGVCNAAGAEVNPRPGTLHESALTAMLRVIDTVRSTVDPTAKHGERTVRMLGNPIAIVRARLWIERTGAGDPSGDPPLLADPLTVAVKIGTATQPDDGVLGCFVPATSPGGGDARFRPVDAAALEDTLVNALADAVPGVGGIDACHAFVHDPAGADTTFPVTTGQVRDLLLLLDLNGGIYATSGVLPRKWIAMPKEFIEGALRNLEPSFRVGPLLSAAEGNVFLPAPQLPGYACEWVERGDADGEGAPISPLPPDGVLPAERVSLTEGWLNLVHADAG